MKFLSYEERLKRKNFDELLIDFNKTGIINDLNTNIKNNNNFSKLNINDNSFNNFRISNINVINNKDLLSKNKNLRDYKLLKDKNTNYKKEGNSNKTTITSKQENLGIITKKNINNILINNRTSINIFNKIDINKNSSLIYKNKKSLLNSFNLKYEKLDKYLNNSTNIDNNSKYNKIIYNYKKSLFNIENEYNNAYKKCYFNNRYGKSISGIKKRKLLNKDYLKYKD